VAVVDLGLIAQAVGVDCRGTAWNVPAAAESLSQLAGVIGGFVFAGIVVLLSQPRPHVSSEEEQTGSARLRALTPFIAAFVAMVLNAYVFGLIAGERGDSCRRIWTATVVASGMLAIGTIATLCGIILLVRAYVARDQLNSSDRVQLGSVELVLRVALRLLAVVAPGLLVQRVYEYLRVWYDGNLVGLQWLWAVVVVIGGAVLVLVTVRPELLTRIVDGPGDGALGFYGRMLEYAVILTILYSVIGTALVGLFLGVIATDWVHVPPVVPWTVATFAILVPLSAILAYLYSIRGITRLIHGNPTVPGNAR
jgi:hypothetical protein